MKQLLIILLTASMLTSCAGINNEGVGTLSGGAIGGLLGSQFGGGSGKVIAAAGGALVGAYLGGNIGRTMDRQDKLQMQQALESTPSGKAAHWKNPDNGNRYTVKPTKTYYHKQQPCREYTTYANIGGKKQQIYGRACRQADGAWKVVK